MNTAITWLLVAIGNGVSSSPALIARFDAEPQCQAVADQLWHRSRERTKLPAHYTTTIDAVCVPAQGVKQ
jgi:hypothetical protein